MKFPVRQDCIVLSADPPTTKGLHDQVRISDRGKCSKTRKKLGWVVRESIGIAVINTNAIKHIKKSIVIGEEIKCQDANIPAASNNLQKSVSTADTTFMKQMQNMKHRLEEILTIFKLKLEKSVSNLWKK